MTEISITLVRKCHPEKAIDEIINMQELCLSHQNIQSIDNLEIFSELRHLNLSFNKITEIENLGFLDQLLFLDLSHNQIIEKSLSLSIKLPRSLRELNLTANPCCSDVNALDQLQTAYPDLSIIIGEEDEESEIDSGKGHDGDDYHLAESDFMLPESDTEAVDSDSVLKSMVERKCLLQNMEPVNNMANIVEALVREFDDASNRLHLRKNRTYDDSREISLTKRMQSLVIESAKKHSDNSKAISDIRQRSLAARDKAFAEGHSQR